MLEIWDVRWHDRKVLIAKYKVCSGNNDIIFTKGTLKGKKFRINGIDLSKYPIESNGRIDCYAIPLDKMEALE